MTLLPHVRLDKAQRLQSLQEHVFSVRKHGALTHDEEQSIHVILSTAKTRLDSE